MQDSWVHSYILWLLIRILTEDSAKVRLFYIVAFLRIKSENAARVYKEHLVSLHNPVCW